MRNKPYTKWLFVAAGLVVGVIIAAYMIFGQSLKGYITLNKANKSYESKNFITASKSYEKLIGKYGNSQTIGEKLVNCYMEDFNYEAALNIIDKYFVDKEITDHEIYDSLKLDQEIIDNYSVAFEETDKITSKSKDANEIIIKLKKLLDNDKDQSIILFNIAAYEADLRHFDEAISDINNAYKKAPEYTWMLEYLSVFQRKNKDISGSIKTCEEALSKNKECVWALRQLSVIDMLNNNNVSALENAKKAYSLKKEYPYVTETLAIAYHVNGAFAERDKLVTDIKKLTDYYDPNLEKIFGGKITVQQYYK